MIEFLPSPCDPDCLSLTFGWIERILEVPRDFVGNVLAESGLNLFCKKFRFDNTIPVVNLSSKSRSSGGYPSRTAFSGTH
jgi:hypothetical protein